MKVTSVIKNVFKADGYSIMQNGGYFNDIGHYHMHVFPRYRGDGFGWTYGDENEEEQNLSQINDVIIRELSKNN